MFRGANTCQENKCCILILDSEYLLITSERKELIFSSDVCGLSFSGIGARCASQPHRIEEGMRNRKGDEVDEMNGILRAKGIVHGCVREDLMGYQG